MAYPRPVSSSIKLEDGREIILETGVLAKQADGAVVVRMGKTALLATVVHQRLTDQETLNYLPLYVDYQEMFAAAGRIPGSFLRREGRPSDHEVLISRLADRTIRPLFPKTLRDPIQVSILLISLDEDVTPGALAALGASAALTLAPVPFEGPISTAHVARVDGKLRIHPQPHELERADIDLIVGGTATDIVMLEGAMDEVSRNDLLDAIRFGHQAIQVQCAAQETLAKAVGKEPSIYRAAAAPQLQKDLQKTLYTSCYDVAKKGIASKQVRKQAFQELKGSFLAKHSEVDADIDQLFADIQNQAIRDLLLKERRRVDGRNPDDIRPIWTMVGALPTQDEPAPLTAHGSALFTRGETQAFATVTLGGKLDEQLVDIAIKRRYNKFMLHYNFPGMSTGEVKPNRGPSRREIGHGNLAMRAIQRLLPDEEDITHTIRVVSHILESNGSSSMATVGASSLALMDAGVKLKAAVGGIAMGLVIDPQTGQHVILSDILGDEDHLGDMDLKAAGTRDGLTACQMDIKVKGLSYEILAEVLEKAETGRLKILDIMDQTLSTPRSDYKPSVPRAEKLFIPRDMIGAVIGSGGKVVQDLQRITGATITIEDIDNQGVVSLLAPNETAMSDAKQRIQAIIAEPTLGEVYQGKVKNIMRHYAFVEFLPGKDGFLHISEVKHGIEDLSKVLQVGETIDVELIDINLKTGKFRLSRKSLERGVKD